MSQIHYIISDAAKLLKVESHVLRYWEEELSLTIPRNKMGHRIYGEKELSLFRQIIQWKEEGLALKEIQDKLSPSKSTSQIIQYPGETIVPSQDTKMQQFKQILTRIVSDAIQENANHLTTDISSQVSMQVSKELDYLFREKEDADEKRFRQLDETIRSFQRARQEAAAAQIQGNKAKNRHKFGKK